MKRRRGKLRRRGSDPYPVKTDPEIDRARYANCCPMQRIELRVIWARRGRGGRNLTARLVNASGHALRMIVESACSHLMLRYLFEVVRSHFLLWRHSHGMTGHGIDDRTSAHLAFAIVRAHIHTRRHRHGRVVFTSCSRRMTVRPHLLYGARHVTSPRRNWGRSYEKRQKYRQRACGPTHLMSLHHFCFVDIFDAISQNTL